MKHISLFSGIGGFDLASDWMGWENVAHCELNTFCQKVLQFYWPNSITYDDIKKTDFSVHRGTIDIVTGGFPCQPYSFAGKHKGKEDERHLWPEMLRAIKQIQPNWVVGENVRGLVNWDGGLVFNEVQSDLESSGYEVFPFLLPAAGVNAPHERYRIWFIAYTNNERLESARHKKSIRREVFKEGYDFAGRGQAHAWSAWPTQSPVCNGDEWLPPKLDGITFPMWRNESIRAGGNSIVPQVAFNIFKAIEKYNGFLSENIICNYKNK